MRLIDHASKWGNIYRHRFYIDGKRVSGRVFDDTFLTLFYGKDFTRKSEGGGGWFRVTYTKESN